MPERGRVRKERSVHELLEEAGLPRNLAVALAFLATQEETTSVEIERATGLRQPEVSLAMRQLRARNWVAKRDVKREGKGRPVHAYRLRVPFGEIVEEIAEEAGRRIREMQGTLERLRRRAR